MFFEWCFCIKYDIRKDVFKIGGQEQSGIFGVFNIGMFVFYFWWFVLWLFLDCDVSNSLDENVNDYEI